MGIKKIIEQLSVEKFSFIHVLLNTRLKIQVSLPQDKAYLEFLFDILFLLSIDKVIMKLCHSTLLDIMGKLWANQWCFLSKGIYLCNAFRI